MEQLLKYIKKWKNPGAEQGDPICLKKKDGGGIYKRMWMPSALRSDTQERGDRGLPLR